MAKLTKKQKEAYKRYRISDPTLTDEECFELYEYDEKHCGSDEEAKEYLENELTTAYVDLDELEQSFHKPQKVATKTRSKKELSNNTASSNSFKEEIIKTIKNGIEAAYSSLFGPLVEEDGGTLYYKDPETGHSISIKYTKHKTQKVVTKTLKRKLGKDAEGNVDYTFSSAEVRAMAIENIIRSSAAGATASYAGSQIGLVAPDFKSPFASIKTTHHKS